MTARELEFFFIISSHLQSLLAEQSRAKQSSEQGGDLAAAGSVSERERVSE
jgi:hypothetical protein